MGNPWEEHDHVSDRQPAFCPYCGHDGAFDGHGRVPGDGPWSVIRCADCGFRFAIEVDP